MPQCPRTLAVGSHGRGSRSSDEENGMKRIGRALLGVTVLLVGAAGCGLEDSELGSEGEVGSLQSALCVTNDLTTSSTPVTMTGTDPSASQGSPVDGVTSAGSAW